MTNMRSVRYTTVLGSPYERGFQSGKHFAGSLRNRITSILPRLEDTILAEQIRDVMRLVKKVFPDYYQEIVGRAAGAGIPLVAYEALMCPELLGEETGCSTIVYRQPDGSVILSHNEDDDYTPDNFMITRVTLPDGSWFVTNDPDKMPFGNGFSWNSHGIVKTINYTHAIEHDLKELPRYFLQRHISEATSLNDFIDRCNISPCASGFHAIALDINSNVAISVEVCNSKISVKTIQDRFCHANHFIHPEICGSQVYVDSVSNSPQRQAIMNQWLDINTQIGREDIRRFLMNDEELFATINEPYITVVNFTVDTSSKEIILRFFLSNQKHSLEFASFNPMDVPYTCGEREANWTKDRVEHISKEDAAKIISGQVNIPSIEYYGKMPIYESIKKLNDIIAKQHPDFSQRRYVHIPGSNCAIGC